MKICPYIKINRKGKRILAVLIFTYSSLVYGAYSKINTKDLSSPHFFQIIIRDDGIKISSPPTFQNKISVVIDNKCMMKLLAKIDSTRPSSVKYLSVPANSTKLIEMTLQKNEKLKFIPQAPAFQEAELSFGKETYEIPSKE